MAPNGIRSGPLVYPFLLGDLHDGDLLAVLAQALKLDSAALHGEQGVVAALADIDAGVDMGAPLADQDVAGQDELTVTPLHAQTLGLGIPMFSMVSHLQTCVLKTSP